MNDTPYAQLGADIAENLVPGSNMGMPIIVEGKGATVADEEGRSYLDLEGGPGVLSVGHCHPTVVSAIQKQSAVLMQGPGRYHSRLTSSLARRIADAAGADRFKRVFFANSGAEANDGAVKIALKHATRTQKAGYGLISLEHSFHGRTSIALSLTGNASRKKGFGPYASFPGIAHVPAPYCYRCPLGLTYPTCNVKCADTVEDALKTRVPGAAAALIAEPVICVGGVLPPPPEYWPKVEAICRKHNVTLICDEVFSGWGRTGRTFAYQHWDVKPDIVTFAKAIGGGLPLGGFVATEELGMAFDEGDHFTTFGANNQVGMAAGHAVLDVLEREQLATRATELGGFFLEGLRRLAANHPHIGDVRGMGLMIGVEIVEDKASRTPAAKRAASIQKHLREQGVLISITGVFGCVLRITPPLVIDQAQIESALRAIDAAIAAS